MRRAGSLFAAIAVTLSVGVACGGQGGPPFAEPAGTPVAPSASATPGTAWPSPSRTAGTVRPSPTRPATVPAIPSGLAGRDLERIPTSRKVVALTFDAGANADAVPSILATLDREGITATFFLTGDFVRRFPSAARSIVAAGHRTGNHTVSHPHLPALADAQVRDQVLTAERLIREATGAQPRPFFRFPYGDRTAHTIALVNAQGYLAVRWTVDSLGWQGTSGGRSAATVTARVLDAAQPGEIVLMHVGSHPTDRSTLDAAALPGIIAGLRQRGYGFVPLDAMLAG
jgi:peptidoglycan/xylan/chitin deacetylase (PgdA/CDA1 family)